MTWFLGAQNDTSPRDVSGAGVAAEGEMSHLQTDRDKTDKIATATLWGGRLPTCYASAGNSCAYLHCHCTIYRQP